jgi:altronate dehydratase large subunit
MDARGAEMGMTFMGYRRADGKVGVRNHVAIIPSVFCANTVVERIAEQVDGAVALRHPVGCGQQGLDLEFTARTLIAMGNHPNVAAVVVVGLGCERFRPTELYEGIKKSGKPVGMLVIQDDGGSAETIRKGVRMAKEFAEQELFRPPVECDISELMVAVKCGGTDATSGLAANPTLGEMCDKLTALGGSAIISELNELIGTEDVLADRAIKKEIADKIYAAVYEVEERMRNRLDDRYPSRNFLMSPGNFDGGVSSIVEKSLGGVLKSGTCPIVDVLEYAVPAQPGKKGMFIMNSDSHDGEVVTGMIGCGAQIVAFTTGRGNPTGFPFVPVIKVTGNDFTYEKMIYDFDFNAGGIISKDQSIKEKGEEFFNLVLRVANGEKTKSETIRGDELFCVARRNVL